MTDEPVTRATLAGSQPTFIVERTSFGRQVKTVDIHRFAMALAEALATANRTAHVLPPDNEDIAKIVLIGMAAEGNGLTLEIMTDHASARHNGRAAVSASVTDIPQTALIAGHMPIVNVSVTRPLDQLARDIVRRVIARAIVPAERIRSRFLQDHERRQRLDETVAALEGRFPNVTFNKSGDGLRGEVHTTRLGNVVDESFFLWGRMDEHGRFVLDRVATFTPEMFVDFLALIEQHFPSKG